MENYLDNKDKKILAVGLVHLKEGKEGKFTERYHLIKFYDVTEEIELPVSILKGLDFDEIVEELKNWCEWDSVEQALGIRPEMLRVNDTYHEFIFKNNKPVGYHKLKNNERID